MLSQRYELKTTDDDDDDTTFFLMDNRIYKKREMLLFVIQKLSQEHEGIITMMYVYINARLQVYSRGG